MMNVEFLMLLSGSIDPEIARGCVRKVTMIVWKFIGERKQPLMELPAAFTNAVGKQ